MKKRMLIRFLSLLILLQVFSSCQKEEGSARLKAGESLVSFINCIQSSFEDYDIPFSAEIDDTSLQELFYIDPEDVEAYIGFYSRAITSVDNLLAVQAKEGKIERILSGMQQRQEDLKANFKEYLPAQYEKACAGQIVTKGDFAVFILLGDLQSDWNAQYQQAKEQIASLFQ